MADREFTYSTGVALLQAMRTHVFIINEDLRNETDPEEIIELQTLLRKYERVIRWMENRLRNI